MCGVYQEPERSTVRTRDLFTLWWSDRGIKGLVFILSPIGIIDALSTMILFQTHGHEYEFNPVVRLMLSINLWPIWFIIDAISFPLFLMIVGTYYVHTRKGISLNVIRVASILVAIRIFGVSYNTLILLSQPDTVMWASLLSLSTYLMLKRLLSRESTISLDAIRRYVQNKRTSLLIFLATRKIAAPIRIMEMTMMKSDSGVVLQEQSTEAPQKRSKQRVWLKRIAWIIGAISMFFLAPFILIGIGILTGGISWNSIYGNFFYWNQLSGITFVIGFFVTLIIFGVVMLFLMNAFDETEGAW
ncbi:MAG: DUF5658 family protein [Candidatus Thorarchaeota archaeon]|nr:DUF5658 family protein [Candidatus Thorarchaeota archaeon]